MARFWPNAQWKTQQEIDSEKQESNLLKLNCDKAFHMLHWNAALNFQETVELTAKWYQTYYKEGAESVPATTSGQIEEYTVKAIQSNLPWTK